MYFKLLLNIVIIFITLTGIVYADDSASFKNKQQNCYILLPLSGDFGVDLELGDGVDASDLRFPIKMINSPFRHNLPGEKSGKELMKAEPFQFVDLNYQSDLNSYDEAILSNTSLGMIIRQTFGIDYGRSSEKTENDNKHSVYYLFTAIAGERQLSSNNVDWKNDDSVLKTISNDDGFKDNKKIANLFIAKYGTHYVGSIKYGIRIAARVQMDEHNKSKTKKLSLAIKDALFTVFSGKTDSNAFRVFKDENLNISVKILSGGLDSAKMPVTLTSLDDIAAFIKSINQEKGVPLRPGAISATLYPYKDTIPPDYANISNALENTTIITPEDPLIIYNQQRNNANSKR